MLVNFLVGSKPPPYTIGYKFNPQTAIVVQPQTKKINPLPLTRELLSVAKLRE